MSRPLVTVYSDKGEATNVHVKLPMIYKAPIRPDLVSFIHEQVRKNHRQPYAVSTEAGHQTSAESWVPVAPWLVFLAFEAAVRIVAVKAPTEICVAAVECSLRRKSTVVGIVA